MGWLLFSADWLGRCHYLQKRMETSGAFHGEPISAKHRASNMENYIWYPKLAASLFPIQNSLKGRSPLFPLLVRSLRFGHLGYSDTRCLDEALRFEYVAEILLEFGKDRTFVAPRLPNIQKVSTLPFVTVCVCCNQQNMSKNSLRCPS